MKNYLIIGHSSGIGAELSNILATEHRVYGTYFTKTPADATANVSNHYLDVTAAEINLDFLPDELHGIAYCPGAINLKPFARVSEADLLKDYQLQVVGAVKIIQACLPRLKKADSASIVLFSTVAVKMGFNFHSIVSASKGAIEGLTKALAAEFAPRIKVNCIAPSITQTPLAAGLLNTPEKIEANAQKHPLKRVGQAQDIAELAAYLLSEKNAWMSGQILNIDGGISSIKS